MLIAIDIDDVLLDFVPDVVEFYNGKYGTQLTKEDFHSYRFSDVWGGSDGECIQEIEEFLRTPRFANLNPIEGAVEKIARLARDHRLISITSRNRNIRGLTERALREHFPSIGEIYFSHNSHVDFENDKTKAQYCLELGVGAIVEDSLIYAEDCQRKGVNAVLLDQPWNRGREIDGVKRVYSWQQIVEYFEC
ncbi:MAG: hypothetical protein KKC19_02505 [Nanoarchaeota archaeon]|nr:hypothetical protein [Nanoarchaeota archaeon]